MLLFWTNKNIIYIIEAKYNKSKIAIIIYIITYTIDILVQKLMTAEQFFSELYIKHITLKDVDRL